MTELQFEGTSADLSYVNAGHLCVIPTVPMVHETNQNIGKLRTVMQWSRCTSSSDKINESIESHKLYQNILLSLKKYF